MRYSSGVRSFGNNFFTLLSFIAVFVLCRFCFLFALFLFSGELPRSVSLSRDRLWDLLPALLGALTPDNRDSDTGGLSGRSGKPYGQNSPLPSSAAVWDEDGL